MRRTTVPLVMVLALAVASCASPVVGPADPAPAAELRGAPALLQAQVRSAALDIVEAYRASVLGGRDLQHLAASPLMRRFAYWLGVTNRAFPGEISATSTVNTVGPATVVGSQGQVLEVEISAQIDVTAQPPDGEPWQFSVPLDGPMRLAAAEPGAWRVIDLVRFGVPVSGTFLPLDLEYEQPGARIILDSFGGVPTWSFNVRIMATGPKVLTLDEADVTLVDPGGAVVGEPTDVSVPLLEVAPGGHIDGALIFEPLEQIEGVSLRIDLGGAADPVPLEIPLRALVAGKPG